MSRNHEIFTEGLPKRPERYLGKATRVFASGKLEKPRITADGFLKLTFILAIAAGGLAGVKMGWERVAEPSVEHIVERIGSWAERTTSDQEKVAEILESADEGQFVRDIRVKAHDSDFVNLRDKPSTEAFEGDESGGRIIGHLENGTKIEMAIPVLGNDWTNPLNTENKGVWYGFYVDGERVGFAIADNFDPQIAWVTQNVSPVDLGK